MLSQASNVRFILFLFTAKLLSTKMAYEFPDGNGYLQNSAGGSVPAVNRKYKKKCKRTLSDLVFETAALCDEVFLMKKKILIVKEETMFYREKLHDLQDIAESHKIKPIPLDITGRPVFPIALGGLTVHSLGEVVSDRPDYHSEDLIFPVGFCSTRVYGSLKDPEKKCVYTCKILDGGTAPSFEIAADSDLDTPIVGNSANECHSKLLQRINHAFSVDVVNTKGRGPEFFGFSHPTIQNLIQSSPGTRKCSSYKWSKFEVNRSGESLMEENDASLSFDALQRSIAVSKSHIVAVIKEEPSDQLLSNSSATLRDLLMS